MKGVHQVWRDIVQVNPGFVSVLRIQFLYNSGKALKSNIVGGRYVIHCHILEHEDNEMMRYFTVKQ